MDKHRVGWRQESEKSMCENPRTGRLGLIPNLWLPAGLARVCHARQLASKGFLDLAWGLVLVQQKASGYMIKLWEELEELDFHSCLGTC